MMKKQRGAWLSGLAIIALLLSIGASACASRNQLVSSFSPDPVPSSSISVSYSSFSPQNVMVASGMSVTWTNKDNTSYFVIGDDQPFAFNLPAEGTFSMTFTDAGVFDYHCRNNPAMQGTVTVLSTVTGQTLPSGSLTGTHQPQAVGSISGDKVHLLPVADIETEIKPSIVEVHADTKSYDTSGNAVTSSLDGTGWVFDGSGLIVTNNHVVEGATSVTVTLENGQSYPAKTVRTDPVGDLAVVDIGVSGLPSLMMTDSSKVGLGDPVVAAGFISGEGIMITQGTISGTDVTFTVKDKETLYDTLQTTAAITYGNSGGPLLDMNGNVIGINSGATFTVTGQEVCGYAITSDTAAPIIQDLITKGYVTRGWIGVTVSDTTELQALGYHPDINEGAIILQVADNSPAAICGLKAGDTVVNLNGKKITSADDLIQAVLSSEVGQQMQITYWRNSSEYSTTITTSQNPQP